MEREWIPLSCVFTMYDAYWFPRTWRCQTVDKLVKNSSFLSILGPHNKPYHTVSSGQYKSPHTRMHTHRLCTNGTRDLCNRWKWVIWIRLDYRARKGEEEWRTREKEKKGGTGVKGTQIKTRHALRQVLLQLSQPGGRSASLRLPVVRMIQRHLWECNLFWLSVSPIPPHSPPTTVIDYYGYKASTSHNITRPWGTNESKSQRLLSPSLLSHEGKGFKKWGRTGGGERGVGDGWSEG